MNRLFLFVIFCLFLVACSNEQPVITGDIVEIRDGGFLIISKTEKLSNEFPNAFWFSTNNTESLEVGQTVLLWADTIETSYPAQAKAERVEIKY